MFNNVPAGYWLGWAAVSAFFALVVAIGHSAFILIWNMIWLAVYAYLYNRARNLKK